MCRVSQHDRPTREGRDSNAERNLLSGRDELLSVASDGDELPGDGWRLLTDAPALGLMSIRALLVEQVLADAPTASDAYWYMPPRKQDDGSSPFVAA